MARDARALREEAAAAVAAGKHKRALAAYLELERLEPGDAQWAKRAGETYRRLGNAGAAIAAFERSADRYAQNGFLVQAIAVCKVVLQLDPNHADTLRRLAEMNERIGATQTRVQTMAEHNPALHEHPSVAVLRQGRSTAEPPAAPVDDGLSRPRKEVEGSPRARNATPQVLVVARTKSKPIALPAGAALDTMELKAEVGTSHPGDESAPGIHVIPIDEEDFEQVTTSVGRAARPRVEVAADGDAPEVLEAEITESTELDLSDLEEPPLPQPRVIGAAAARALAATPLFAGLPSDALRALVEKLQLVSLERGVPLFREGDPGDALYVLVEGELALFSEGPPRVEISRQGPGSFFGEVALLTDQPRPATAVCTSPSELLRIDRHTLSRVLADHGDVLRAVLRFARDRLVERLKAIDEGGTSLLDNSLLMLASSLFDGDAHGADQLPIVLAGKAGSALQTGRILNYLDKGNDNRRACSLFLSVMDMMGVQLDRFGDADNRLAGL